jgi:hypothetical protein
MMRIELIRDPDCSAADDARKNLREARLGANLPPQWTEWERTSSATAELMRAFGSLSIQTRWLKLPFAGRPLLHYGEQHRQQDQNGN